MKNKVIIIFSAKSGGVKNVSKSLNNTFKKNEIKSHILNMYPTGNNSYNRIINTLKVLKNQDKNTIFILMHFDAILIGFLLNRLGYKNTINVIHTDLYEYYKSISLKKKSILKLIFIAMKNKINIFVSKEAEIRAKKFFNLKNSKCIYNIIQHDLRKEKIPINYKEKKTINLGVVSRLHKEKNIDLAIRVIKELNKQGESVNLFIYGDGIEFDRLKQYVHHLKCENNVVFLGHVNDKNKIFNSFDALISFSSIEGLPTIILESFKFNKPVYFTDCHSGPRELISPHSPPEIKTPYFEYAKYGFLVRPIINENKYAVTISNDEKIYTHTLKKFILYLRTSKFDVTYDLELLSINTIISQWKTVFNEIIK